MSAFRSFGFNSIAVTYYISDHFHQKCGCVQDLADRNALLEASTETSRKTAESLAAKERELEVLQNAHDISPTVPTNLAVNGDFELGTSPWEVAYHPSYSQSNLVSDGYNYPSTL